MNQDIYVLIEHIQGQVAEISYMLLAQARALTQQAGGQVIAIQLNGDGEPLAQDFAADCVWLMADRLLKDYGWDAYMTALAHTLSQEPPRIMLFGDTSLGAEIAGGLSARLGFPVVSSCRELAVNGGQIRFVSQICGGKMMAEGVLPDETSLVICMPGAFKAVDGRRSQPPATKKLVPPAFDHIRVTLRAYEAPSAGDVDISKETSLIAVGRGIQREDNLELAKELADAMGASLCATRPVIDQGWLPASRLVGKSGKQVKPKLYLALGISGAPEHTESITGSETIIAVNTDPQAPIFDYARYGAQVDLLDLLPLLTERLQNT